MEALRADDHPFVRSLVRCYQLSYRDIEEIKGIEVMNMMNKG